MPVAAAYCLALVAVTIAFDAAAYWRKGWHGTISYQLLSRSQRYPIIAFAVGVVIGHLFWPQPDPTQEERPDRCDDASEPPSPSSGA